MAYRSGTAFQDDYNNGGLDPTIDNSYGQAPARRVRNTNSAENEAGYSAGASRTHNAQNNWAYAANANNQSDADYDPDLARAAILQRYLQGEGGLQNNVKEYAGDLNTDVAKSAMANLLARAGQRREMRGQLGGLGAQQGQDENMMKRDASQALGEGVRNTRQNFNNRGLLYGGMREGGESQVKAGVASQLSSNMAGVKRDYAKQGDAMKTAIAQLGLATQKESQERVANIQDQTMKNNVARMQAYQQLGEGVGYAGGTIAHGMYGGATPQAPNATAGGSQASPSGGMEAAITGKPSWFYGDSPRQYAQPINEY